VRRHLTILVGLALAAGMLSVPRAEANPEPTCLKRNSQTRICVVYASDPGTSGGDGAAPVNGSGGGGGPAVCRDYDGKKLPCSYRGAWWSPDKLCYVHAAQPQPPKSDPAWSHHTSGAIYQCLPFMGPFGLQNTVPFWLATAPGPAAVDPAQLARSAIAKMRLRAIDIGLANQPRPGGRRGYVGAPIWMWVNQPGAQTIGPQTANAAAGAVTVTANAQMERIVWNMGDGDSVTCHGVGTPYEPRYDLKSSPTCGYHYNHVSTHEPGGAYRLSATSYWTVNWTGGGQSGTIPLNFTAAVQLRIAQLEAIVTH
jgi:hypothetical protein